MRRVLASASPRRRELLRELFQEFEVIPSCVDENIAFESPQSYVTELARLKAKSVYDTIGSKDGLQVIGADTTVILNDRVLGKPENREQAIEMLFSLLNTTHYVYTGVCVVDERGERVGCQRSKVSIGSIPSELVYSYIDSGQAYDKAGGYGIQDFKGFITIFDGEYDNVVGLPLSLTEKLCKNT